MRKFLLSTALALGLSVQAQALSVFDAANYVQNLLTAVRTLQIITNQVKSLANEALSLEYMARDLARLDFLAPVEEALAEINALMARARGIAFEIGAVEAEFSRLFPREYSAAVTTDALVIDARARWQHQMDALRQAMLAQAQVVTRVRTDTDMLRRLLAESQGAAGNLQVQQAGNQLLGFLGAQQLQTQSLMAAQFRAQALEEARAAMSEEQARAQLQRFLGDGVAYRAP